MSTAIPSQQPPPQPQPAVLPPAALDAFDALRDFMLNGVTLADGTYLPGFPGLWKVMEACLCLCVSLMFKHRPAAMALTIIGTPGSGKGTVLEMFSGHPNLLVRLDDANLAGWVSQAKKRVAGQDLMEEVKHKVVIVADTAGMFYGKDPISADKYWARVARILDAKGLVLSGGYQGRVGHHGDYLFGLIGGGTPPSDKDHKSMARVGPRLVSIKTDYDGIGDLTEEEMEGSDSYAQRVEIGRQFPLEGASKPQRRALSSTAVPADSYPLRR